MIVIQIFIDSEIRIIPVNRPLASKIIDELTIKNPAYAKRKAMGLPVWGIPRLIKFYNYVNNALVLPRGYLERLKEILNELDFTVEWFDHRLTLPEVYFNSQFTLRDYQLPVISEAITAESGVIVAPCGSGKTEMALALTAKIGQSALWLTHTKDLFNQTVDRAVLRLGLAKTEIGILNADKWIIGDKLTVGMVPSMSKHDLKGLINKFGTVIIDECHHCFKDAKSFAMFYAVLTQFPARYRIGVTATPHRSDGLVESIFLTIGQKIYEVPHSVLRLSGQVIVPVVKYIETDFRYDASDDLTFNDLLNSLCQDNARSSLVSKVIVQNAVNHYSLVLGDRIEHLQQIMSMVNAMNTGIRTALVTGDDPKKLREAVMQKIANKELDVLFATYQLAKEGLDIPHLDRLFMVTPKRDYALVTQAVGRISRPAAGKADAVVYDFYDIQVGVLINQAKSRRSKVYRKLDCQIFGWRAPKKTSVEDILKSAF